ncbi:TetR family transcriptional regulator [Nocardia tenerifensis]|uniref:TetR family transcriptional regulator n=1 Tax=Nocardia tenerifensis TaxID=228006 RepID=A0A318K0I7_9NOCA|nr:TetR/AcrR family transcriptional regulator [Nocardia tenerifensis]PXX63967.1 TetR family transcriptional regulator [Nocardia tenerifensis]
MSTPLPPNRTGRTDARRNRERVLAAARALFAERGDEVQMPELAKAAGVGVGTVYRHFPTRGDLIEAVAEHRFAELAEYARTECRNRPERGLELYLAKVGEVLAGDRGLSSAIEAARGTTESEPRGAARAELEAAVRDLLDDGRAAGSIRADATVGDVYMLVGALSATIRTGSGDWRRLIDLAMNGLGA